jgi:2-dehydro-3-deoxy-D-gluconate 5-dehydrogenase
VKAFDLNGRVAIVTGGSSGIGFGMARGLAAAGAAVVIAARNLPRAEDAAATLRADGGEATAVGADVSQPADVTAMVAAVRRAHGRIDILVNNAGTNIRKAPEAYTLDEWRTLIDANLTSAFLCAQAVYPAMQAAGGGKILNNGSMASIFGLAFAGPYGAAKGGVVQLTRSLAVAWAKDNIQVNAFLPGWIDTPLTAGARRDVAGLHEKVVGRCPAARWGTPEDFAGIAVFLASRASDYITGTAIPVDGGYSVAG